MKNSTVSLKKFKELTQFSSAHIINAKQSQHLYQPRCLFSDKVIQNNILIVDNAQEKQKQEIYQSSTKAFEKMNHFIISSNYQNYSPQKPSLQQNKSDLIQGQSPHVSQQYKGSYIIKSSFNAQLSNQHQNFLQNKQKLPTKRKKIQSKQKKDKKKNLNSKKQSDTDLQELSSFSDSNKFEKQQDSQEQNIFFPVRTNRKPDTLFIQVYRKIRQRIQAKQNFFYNQQKANIKHDSKHRRGYTYDFNDQLIPLKVFQGHAKFKNNLPLFTPLSHQQISNNYPQRNIKRNGRIINKNVIIQKQQFQFPEKCSTIVVNTQKQSNKQRITINYSNFNALITANDDQNLNKNVPFHAFKKQTSKYKQEKNKQKLHANFLFSRQNSPIKKQKNGRNIYKSQEKLTKNNAIFEKVFQIENNQIQDRNITDSPSANDKIQNRMSFQSCDKDNANKNEQNKMKLNLGKSFMHLNLMKQDNKQQKVSLKKKPNYRISCRSVQSIDTTQEFNQIAEQFKSKSIREQQKNAINNKYKIQFMANKTNTNKKLKRQRR